MLRMDGVTKVFTQKSGEANTVLDNIAFTIDEGEFVSLLGPSGCGKSTLLSLIAGLQRPTSGAIYLEEDEVKEPSPNRGVVFQQAGLFPWLSVRENVMYPLRKRLRKKERKDVADRYLKMVQLGRVPDHYPHELSGGMQQRVSIARVLAMDPEVLLMDEPFGALDEQTRNILQAELEKIWLEARKTVVFVTHSIREAIKLSDRVVIMGARPGRIIADIKVDLPRPRVQADMVSLESEIMELLRVEIEKVTKEELNYATSS